MIVLNGSEVEKNGGSYLSSSQLSLAGKMYSRGGSFPESSRNLALAMAQSYEKSGKSCILVSSTGMMTIWREVPPQESTLPPLPPLKPEVEQITPPPRPVTLISIAYVEDNPIEAKLMESILEDLHLSFPHPPAFTHIKDPTFAVPTMLRTKPELIFLDLNMPVVNGYEICSQLRRVPFFQETPIVILTSSDGVIDRVRGKVAGASDFIAKPIDREKVLSVLKKHHLVV